MLVKSIAACLLLVGVTAIVAAEAPDAQLVEKFRADCASQAAAAEKADSIAVRGRDDWLFLAREFEHVAAGTFWGDAAAKVSKAAKPEQADPLPAILDFKAQLEQAGIEL